MRSGTLIQRKIEYATTSGRGYNTKPQINGSLEIELQAKLLAMNIRDNTQNHEENLWFANRMIGLMIDLYSNATPLETTATAGDFARLFDDIPDVPGRKLTFRTDDPEATFSMVKW